MRPICDSLGTRSPLESCAASRSRRLAAAAPPLFRPTQCAESHLRTQHCGAPMGAAGDDAFLRRVLDGLGPDPVHPDELAVALGMESAPLAAALTTLQLRGAITDVYGGRVARTV